MARCWKPLSCFLFLLLFVSTVEGASPQATNSSVQVLQKDGEFDKRYVDIVTSEVQIIYTFNHTVTRNKTEGVRVSVELLSETTKSPVLFVVRQKQAVLSFQVPLILRGLYQRKYQYTQVSRTLCQPPTLVLSETQFFYVDVSTLSTSSVKYQLRFFKYAFPDGADTVIVKVNSQKNFPCSVMSIQDIQCPVFDLDNNVAFIGMYQTMTKKAAITVQRKDFPSNSFYVVIVVKTEDEACGGPLRFYPLSPDELLDAGNRSKTLEVVVSPAIDSEVYVMGMLFCLGIFLFFYVVTFLMHKKREELLKPADMSPAETGQEAFKRRPISTHHVVVRFDTSFMYMIAGLCMLKLYQKRHPDINASAYSAYACLAAIIFFSVLGVKTPAESREHNRDCILLSFFDDHDIWHFLSSIAMFGSFLVLLTMDDDLDTVQRDKIYVF
ncbi:SID1 transmembrane family member 2 [Bagarius yarrelli]|uniref:SID1 transmembrane family member 2 n=1 Tax=Bagarius yarrelli TaxID=175774 RepID=A0A556TTQ2_BAGYA|nr:SID1 transmembrane family member 2 [Bagarius yarrelli]